MLYSTLPGGKESTESFKAISTVISKALVSTAVPNDCLQLVTTRDVIEPLLKLDQYIDLVIPRGSNDLVRTVKQSTQIPVLGHADGLCTIYLRADCPRQMAVKLLLDAKTSYPAACNSVETLLVDEDALETLWPGIAEVLIAAGVALRCDKPSKDALPGADAQDKNSPFSSITDATEAEYDTEFLDLILAVKTIPKTANQDDAVDAAVQHINAHSSHHTDAILTASPAAAQRFLDAVDSACVFWNTSTRMSDGQRFGLGTEVGISTNKIHARGPVGLEGLTIHKWVLRGEGQASRDYGAGGRSWKHEVLEVGKEEGGWERVARTEEEWEVLKRFRDEKGVK